MKVYNIAEIGSFDVENYGDLLFPIVLKGKLEKQIKIGEFILFSPNGGKKPFEEETYVYPIDHLEKMHQKIHFDAIIIGGGDVIRLDKDVLKCYPKDFKSSLNFWMEPIIVAKKYNIPVIFNCPGVPHYFQGIEQEMISSLLNQVDYLSVRDQQSKDILSSCGVNCVQIFPDTIVGINQVYLFETLKNNVAVLKKQNRIPDKNNYLILQHNRMRMEEEDYIEELRNFVTYILDITDYDLFLMPIGYVHNDIEFLEKIKVEHERVHIIYEKFSPFDMISVFACSKGFIGTSLHGLITTSAYDVPIMCLNTMKLVKTSGYLKLIGKDNVDVTQIKDVYKVFDKFFMEKYNNNILSVRKDVEKHFDQMIHFITRKKEEISHFDNRYIDIVNMLMEQVSTTSHYFNTNLLKGCAYYSNNEYLDETKKETIIWNKDKDNQYFGKLVFLHSLKLLRIDPIEGTLLALKNVVITINNEPKAFNIPNAYCFNNIYYILSLDPQIILFDLFVEENKELKIDISFEVIPLTMDKLIQIYNLIIDQLNQELLNLKTEINEKSAILEEVSKKSWKTLKLK